MDWFAYISSHRRATIFLILLLACAVLAVSALMDPASLDTYWHLKMGQDWVEKGLSPFVDHYSITDYGETILDPPFIFQTVTYGFVELLGLIPGFKAFVFLNSLLVLGVFLGWLRMIRAPLPIVAICVFMFVVFLQQRVMVRPEMFSYWLIIIAMLLYERARIEPVGRNFLYIAILMLFWRNNHLAIFGYVIFFGLFLDIAISQLKNEAPPSSWIQWAFWGWVILLVGFLGHGFTHPVWEQLNFPKEWLYLIDEYKPPLKGSPSPVTLGLIPVAIVTLIGLLHQRLLGYFVVCAVFSWYALTVSRMTAPGGLVIICLFALVLTRYNLGAHLATHEKLHGRVISVILLFMLLTSLLTGVLSARHLIARNQYMLGYFPDRMVDYMKEREMHGRILNDHNVGGYLIYHLGDDSRVYIDGRTHILYSLEHMQRWREVMGSPDLMVEEIESLDIDYLVIPNRRGLLDVVRRANIMELEFSDLRYTLFARNDAALPISGSLWSMPWCWNTYAGDALKTEKDKALAMLPNYSPVANYVQLISEYHLAPDQGEFLHSLRDESYDDWYEDNLRFAGYRALELGHFDLAIDWFQAVREKQLKDYMAWAMAYMLDGNFEEAEKIFANSLRVDWKIYDPNEIELLYREFVYLRSNWNLNLLDKSDFDQIEQLAGHKGEVAREQPLTFEIFCR